MNERWAKEPHHGAPPAGGASKAGRHLVPLPRSTSLPPIPHFELRMGQSRPGGFRSSPDQLENLQRNVASRVSDALRRPTHCTEHGGRAAVSPRGCDGERGHPALRVRQLSGGKVVSGVGGRAELLGDIRRARGERLCNSRRRRRRRCYSKATLHAACSSCTAQYQCVPMSLRQGAEHVRGLLVSGYRRWHSKQGLALGTAPTRLMRSWRQPTMLHTRCAAPTTPGTLVAAPEEAHAAALG